MSASGAVEDWAQRPENMQLLGSMLADPGGDHAAAVAKNLDGILLDAHVASIVRVLGALRDNVAFSKSFTTDGGVALHTVLYHLLGGAERNLPAPPTESTRAETSRCAPGLRAAKKMAEAFFTDRDEARRQAKKGGDDSVLQRLRGRIFAPATHKNLRPAAAGDAAGDAAVEKRAAGSRRVAAAPPAPPPADPADAELQRRADCCAALAMGTHHRLGLQSRVHWLRGLDDVFRLIAAHAQLRTTEWFARPLPKEIPTLRLHLRLEHGGRQLAEQLLDGANVTIAAQQRQLERAQRQAESALRQAESALQATERTRAQFDEFRRGLLDDCAAWKARVQQECHNALKEQRLGHAQQTRGRGLEASMMLGRERALREEAERSAARKAQDADKIARGQSAEQMRQLKAAWREAEEQAAALEQQAAEQQAALERLRAARNGSALERQRALEEELRVAKQRRTKNQRRVQTSYLADRRARDAEGRAAEAQARLGEFAIEDEDTLQRAARADALEKQARALVGVRGQARGSLRCALTCSLAGAPCSLAGAQVAELQASLKEQTELAAKYRAVVEPPKEKFFANGHYTAAVDLTALETIADLGISPSRVPQLFVTFADFYGVTIPKTELRKVQTGYNSEGKRTYEMRRLLWIPSKTHCKELPAVGGELHKIQAGEWLLEDPDAKYCYIADAANSQQKEILAQILSRRNKETGRLESMALSIDEISDKTSEGQQRKFKAVLEAISEAWEEADQLGLLDTAEEREAEVQLAEEQVAEEEQAPIDQEPEPATAFFERQRQRRKELRVRLKAKISELRAASTMNDRAANGRKAGRLSRGGNGSGGEGDVTDDPTCAHHAVANTGEEGRKAIDKLLKEKMNITEEQSESDSAKVKALRTNVGWFSSPACSLIYQVRAACPRPPPCCMTSSAWSPLASF